MRTMGYDAIGPTDFERPVTMPDGRKAAAKFATFQWPVKEAPGGVRLFACQHKTRETVWIPELQKHANTAKRIATGVHRDAKGGGGRKASGQDDRGRGADGRGWIGHGADGIWPRRFRVPQPRCAGEAISRRRRQHPARARRRRAGAGGERSRRGEERDRREGRCEQRRGRGAAGGGQRCVAGVCGRAKNYAFRTSASRKCCPECPWAGR